ncbi:MAG: ABC transporter ATP-binding protein [Xenococcaceae cyanobacterium]
MHSSTNLTDTQTVTQTLPVLETWKLSKVYRTGFWMNQKIESLKECSLSVNRGETFGLLGPNGAGKTTLLKILLGIIRSTSGKAALLGHPIGDRAIKQKIGYLPENAYFYDYLTAWEFMELAAGLFQIPRSLQKQRIPQLLDLVGLAQSTARKKKLRQYSKGMLQRVGLAQALINDPELVFLDEPMSGLDPLGRYRMKEIILSLKQEGKTIFFNSHVLADVEQICDRVAILALGELLCVGSLEEILGSSDELSNAYQVIVKGGDPQTLKTWIPNIVFKDNYWHGSIRGNLQEFIATLEQTDARLISATIDRQSLEEFFIKLLRERGIEYSR